MIRVSKGINPSSQCNDVASGLAARFEARRPAKPVPEAIAWTQLMPLTIDSKREGTAEQRKMVFMARDRRLVVGDPLVRLDHALDEFEPQSPAWRGEGAPRIAIVRIEPNALLGMAHERRKPLFQGRQQLRDWQREC